MPDLLQVMEWCGHRDGSNFYCLCMIGDNISQKKGRGNCALILEEDFFTQARMRKAFQERD